jgi:putative heme iron utilization protein
MDKSTKDTLVNLINSSKIASLGTSLNNVPYVSMVSYSYSLDLTEFYVHLSQLAFHTQNILSNPNVSLMICQPETLSNNPQTLARISINGIINAINSSNNDYEKIKDNFLMKNPKSKLYFNLGDFILFKLIVQNARFVAGFGQTYNLSLDDMKTLAG